MRSAAMMEFSRHWRVVLGCTIGTSIGVVSLYVHSSGAFAPALIGDAGYTRVQLSLAVFILTILVAVSLPFSARVIEHFGARRVIAFSILGEAAGFASLAILPTSFPAFLMAVGLLAMLGAATTPPAFAYILTQRFDYGRGAALGIMTGGLGLTAIVAPILSSMAIAAFGWRAGFGILACIISLLGALAVFLIPSDETFTHERIAPTLVTATCQSGAPNVQIPGWRLALAFGLPALGCGGYLLHLIDMLIGRGISPLAAAGIQSLMGVAILLGRVGSGLLVDRFPAQIVVAILFASSASGCGMLALAGMPLWGVACFAIGLTIGSEMDMMAFFISRYFGPTRFTRLYGSAYAGLILIGGLSPLVLSSVVAVTGYAWALIGSALCALTGAILAATLPNPAEVERIRNG